MYCHDSCDLTNSPEARQWRTAREAIGRRTSGHCDALHSSHVSLGRRRARDARNGIG